MVSIPAALHAKFSEWQATSKTDWLCTLIGYTSAYLACDHFDSLQTQIFLATIVIGKNINEPKSSNTATITHRNH
jgi:hypothetical protein